MLWLYLFWLVIFSKFVRVKMGEPCFVVLSFAKGWPVSPMLNDFAVNVQLARLNFHLACTLKNEHQNFHSNPQHQTLAI